ncbi:hypothetical protein [Halomarina litorea]|uniref:hypothetical protein n=1 Tax=Halomarina litorea TaxID=2961595 RepID=UPI0020C3B717|nr:hypothetical protein [Halomarina sp. BCD28]
MTRSDASLGLYDLLLVVMPVSLALGGFASLALSVSTATGMLGGSIPAGGAVWYGLFVDPPETDAT